MSGRAGTVGGTAGGRGVTPAVPREHGSGAGPASTWEGQRVSAAWPLRSHLALGALPTAVPCARLHARLVLAEWSLDSLTDTVELIVSELVTNAVQASAGLIASRYQGRWRPGAPPIRLWLHSDHERVLIQVWDGNDQMPRRQELAQDAEHGRGLLLVESLSVEWGVFAPERPGGKVVWATATGPLTCSLAVPSPSTDEAAGHTIELGGE